MAHVDLELDYNETTIVEHLLKSTRKPIFHHLNYIKYCHIKKLDVGILHGVR
jgi:hypothetical protein